MKTPLYSGLAITASCILLFSACALGFEPAWKGKTDTTAIAFQLATPDLPSSSSYARAIALGGGFIYIRTIGGPSGNGTMYGPYRVASGAVFETTDVPPGTYDGIGVLYAPEPLESKHIVYPTVDTPFATLMRMSDADFGTFSDGESSKFNEMLDGDVSGFKLNNVTLKSGTTNTLKLTLAPITGPASTVIIGNTINLSSSATLKRKFIKVANVIPTVGNQLSEVNSSIPPGTTLGVTAFYNSLGKLLQAFPAPVTNPIVAPQVSSTPYTTGDYFYFYIEYQAAAAINVAFDMVEIPIVYTVNFDSQGATTPPAPLVKTVTFPATTVVTLPTAPLRSGYTFNGWFTAPSGGGTSFAGATPVSTNLTVYAHWISLSADANLSALVVNSLPLVPTFTPATLLYTASASNSFLTVSVTPTVVDPAATIRVRINSGGYSAVISGTASGTLILDSPVGTNVIDIEVTAPDLVTIKTYSVTVNKTVLVTINSGANGTVLPDGAQERIPGALVPLVATPVPGYRFDTWTGTATVAPNNLPSATLTVNAVNSMAMANFIPDFAGGTGMIGDPYLVSNIAQLKNMNNFRSSVFKLTANIDLISELNWTPIGDSTTNFTGEFDGDVFTITNLTINQSIQDRGLFGVTNNAIIKNVTLTGINFILTFGNAGGLIGHSLGSTQVTSCSASGTISAYEKTGGLIGWSDGSTSVLKSWANVAISSTSLGGLGGLIGWTSGGGGSVSKSYALGPINTPARDTVGGLVGFNSVPLSDCYATGSVAGLNNVGGLVGMNSSGNIDNCYSTGLVSGTITGGLVGTKLGGTVTGGFYDLTTSGQSDTGKGAPEITTNMKKAATFTGWDFVIIWDNVETVSYPFLR